MFQCCPVRNQVRVGNQYPGCFFMGLEHTDRLTRLDEQCFVLLEVLKRTYNLIETVPIAGSPTDPTVDNEFGGVFRDLRIQVVHQHAHRGLGPPVLALKFIPGWCFDVSFWCVSVECCGWHSPMSGSPIKRRLVNRFYTVCPVPKVL